MSEAIDFSRTKNVLLKATDQMNDELDKSFECSNQDYTKYYNYDSLYDTQENLARTYLLKQDDKVLGFVSIAMAHLRKENTEAMRSKGTDGNIPALLISHLATHKDHLRKKIGTALIDIALEQAKIASKNIGCRYLMLNPENDEGVRQFYKNFGFTYIPNLIDDKNSDAFILDISER